MKNENDKNYKINNIYFEINKFHVIQLIEKKIFYVLFLSYCVTINIFSSQ